MIYAQFNASTLKASFVAADKKSQMIRLSCDCDICENAPYYLTLTFSDLVDCGCNYYITSAIAALINDIKWVIPFDTPSTGYCSWGKRFTGNFGTVTLYTGLNCTGEIYSQFTFTEFSISVILQNPSSKNIILSASLKVGDEDHFWGIFSCVPWSTPTFTGCSGCSLPNAMVSCEDRVSRHDVTKNGSLLIEDGDTT